MAVLVAEAYLIVNGVFLLLFISMCLQHQAFYGMVQHSLNEFDHHSHHSDGGRANKEFLCKLIRFHIMIKKWAIF